ncbi:MAG TPA: hypothetical protein VEK57_25600 [Thermoanaerobaculia bacterium]|nr:hypothetical protein [Thermoanaerobaculia bacterium]
MRRSLEVGIIIIAAFCAVTAHAVPAVQTITGSPLTILIGDDTSYQVLNSTIGPIGQIYPGGCTTSVADAGIFTSIGGVLYAPDFQAHPCGSAMGGISPSVPWVPVSTGAVTGSGTALSPFAVNVVVDAGTTGVRMSATYSYVNGDPFFRITKVFTSTNPVALNVYTGADIYLGGSDRGVPYLEPTSTSPGGRDCGAVPGYTILLIPTTPADHYAARLYNSVWTEIGQQGNLSDTVGSGCMDNGAALQWQRTLSAGGSTTITSAVSFGPIPAIVQFNVTSVSPPQGYQGNTLTVVITGIGFQSNTTFDFGPGITVTTTAINSSTQATVTIAIAPAATVGPRNVTGTQSPGGLTATLVNGFTVLAREDCARIRDSRVLCTTDGTGDYLITFTFQNLSTQTVQHLFLTGLPAGVTATPGYVLLSPPVAPNGNATIGPIRISGASPGVLALTLNLHNGELEECCSVVIRFELPRCDCAQVVESSGPSCRPGGGYTYTFAYQNLFNGPIQSLLLTPEIPTTATFSPNVIPLNPPMVYGEIRTFTITISNAPGSQALCFRITSKSERCDHCCSIRRCVFLPRCIGDVVVIGNTELEHTAEGITIASDTNEPGCTFPLAPDTTDVDLEWLPIPDALPAGSFVEQRYRGSVDGEPEQVIATTRTVVDTNDSELRTTFNALDATRYRYEFLNGGRLVGTRSGVPSDTPAICNGCGGRMPTRDAHFTVFAHFSGTPASEEGQPACLEQGFPCLFAGYTFKDTLAFRFQGEAVKFDADEVRVWPENGVGEDIRLSAVDFQARGPHSVTFTGVSVTVDCNANGADDLTDIASGASLDVDRNGIPDECQGRGADLDLSLNTGFNEILGTTIARGSDDDDWRLLNANIAGAAKVMRNPHAVWPAAFPQSAWISVSDRGESMPGRTTLQFENCFCIGSGASTATLDLQVRADNAATVYLNNAQISATGGAFSGAPLTVHLAGRVGGDGLFRTGRNCVRIDVNDTGIVTGLDAAGTIRAAHGSCDGR